MKQMWLTCILLFGQNLHLKSHTSTFKYFFIKPKKKEEVILFFGRNLLLKSHTSTFKYFFIKKKKKKKKKVILWLHLACPIVQNVLL